MSDLGSLLSDREFEDALVICGRTVGANRAVTDPIEEGLGDRLAGVFDETTPEKRLETVFEARDRLRDLEGTSEDGLRHVAELTHGDAFMANCPPGFDPSVDDLESVLREAW